MEPRIGSLTSAFEVAGEGVAQPVLDPPGRLQQIGERDQGTQPGLGVRRGGRRVQHPQQDLGALVGAAERAQYFGNGELRLGKYVVLPAGRFHLGQCAEFRQCTLGVAAVPLPARRHQSPDEVEPADPAEGFGRLDGTGYFVDADAEAFREDLECPAAGNALPAFHQRDVAGRHVGPGKVVLRHSGADPELFDSPPGVRQLRHSTNPPDFGQWLNPAGCFKSPSHNECSALYQAVKKKSTDIRIPPPVFTESAEIISTGAAHCPRRARERPVRTPENRLPGTPNCVARRPGSTFRCTTARRCTPRADVVG